MFVTICYGQSQEVDLQVRNPSVTEWHVAQRVFECLMPIMETCVLNQARESWLLSETISSYVTLTAKLTKISEDALPTDGSVEPGTSTTSLECTFVTQLPLQEITSGSISVFYKILT